jgi:DNA-binding NarL/FixJ family response regulator
MIKVCIADNHPVVRFGLKKYFHANKLIRVNHLVGSFFEAIEAFRKDVSDVLIIDLELPDFGNISVIKTIFTEFPETRVIIFSNLADRIYAPSAFKMGVSAYIKKSESIESLEEVIIRVNKRDLVINENIQRNLSITPNNQLKERLYEKLSKRELQVLILFCEGKKNYEIAAFTKLTPQTISTYKLRLYDKLHVTNVIDLVNKAISLQII